MSSFKPTLCVDFDGVIHRYSRGWQKDGAIYDDAVPGFFEWLKITQKYFRIVIYSSRSDTPEGIELMKDWLTKQYAAWLRGTGNVGVIEEIEFSNVKPPAWLTIDDRAIHFKGDWSASELSVDAMLNFKPWNG
jgi:hypothetical protein